MYVLDWKTTLLKSVNAQELCKTCWWALLFMIQKHLNFIPEILSHDI